MIRPGAEDGDMDEAHEINVTPFIDVMLVLTIIFMVAAPLSTVDVPLDLPPSGAAPAERPDIPIFLSLDKALTLHLANEDVPRERLGAALEAATAGDHDTRIFLRADRAVAYGDLMAVMDLLRAAGFFKVALVGLEAVPDGNAP
ncbi:outer membrane transport energization protein ExbD [Rhodobacter viridis]|uniref:Biopolymer transport protein ExbD n=1 Tax=Rhodobacter viridis TaxID=1054202 RepID=A0A318TV49_9RHOB|nr:TonB system transport protein ExbD [Rhodobacter viridis]PYF08682.1 outer membrane transport energization protein ExbD [Rhodobacter viridis]